MTFFVRIPFSSYRRKRIIHNQKAFSPKFSLRYSYSGNALIVLLQIVALVRNAEISWNIYQIIIARITCHGVGYSSTQYQHSTQMKTVGSFLLPSISIPELVGEAPRNGGMTTDQAMPVFAFYFYSQLGGVQKTSMSGL